MFQEISLHAIIKCMNFLQNTTRKTHTLICYLLGKETITYNDYDKMMLQYIPKCGYEIKGLYFNSVNPKLSNHLFMYPNNTKERRNRRKW